jgi:hypothetical protein
MKLNKMLLAALMIIGFAFSSKAQSTAFASTSATIMNPVGLSKTDDIRFDNINSLSTAATVKSQLSEATFTVTGEKSYVFDITVSETVVLTSNVNEATMKAETFISAENVSSQDTKIKVGASLNVNAAQHAGFYSSNNLQVTVNYN